MEDYGNKKVQGGAVNLSGILITALFVLMEAWFFYRLLRMKFLPGKYMWLIGAALVVLAALIAFLCWNMRKKGLFVAGTLLAIILSGGMIFGSGIAEKVRNTVQQWAPPTEEAHQTIQMGVYVLSDGPIRHLNDLDGKTLGIMESVDRKEAEQVLDEISAKLTSLEVVTFTGFVEVAQALYRGEIHAAILEEGFIAVLGNINGFEDVSQRILKVTEYRAERPTQPATAPAEESAASTAADATETSEVHHGIRTWRIVNHRTGRAEETDDTKSSTQADASETWESATLPPSTTAWPEGSVGTDPPPTQAPTAWGIGVPAGQEGRIFTVYISGLDTRGGGLASRGNSDVNILAVVNMNTHQILLISTPRDFYVSFPVIGGAQDKLTHAGYYSVQASMDALRGLYGVSCQYYARIGFDGTVRLVDALGGVDVYSSYAFEAGSYHINAGTNHLDGAQALAFVRQRYNMPGGDRARGTNQMAMIKAIFQKMTSSTALSNLSEVLAAVGGLMQTTLPYDTIAEVSRRILGGESWNMASYSVNGSNGYSYCPSIGTEAFVMYPDYSTVSYAQSLIRQVYEGGWVSP